MTRKVKIAIGIVALWAVIGGGGLLYWYLSEPAWTVLIDVPLQFSTTYNDRGKKVSITSVLTYHSNGRYTANSTHSIDGAPATPHTSIGTWEVENGWVCATIDLLKMQFCKKFIKGPSGWYSIDKDSGEKGSSYVLLK